jgi:flagellar biosynthesis/type III secretory pathway protein FliH
MSSSSSAFAFEQLSGPSLQHAADPVADALAAAEAIREQARAEGFEAGRGEALAEGRAQLEPAAGALAAALEAAAESGEQAVARAEREAVELALALADKIVAAALEARPELVCDVVAGALRGLLERRHVQLFVNPDDLELVSAAVDGLRETLGGIETLDVQAERRVGRGGAVLRTPEGEIDATVRSKLERAREIVAGELGA